MKNIMVLLMTAPLLMLSNGYLFLQGVSSFLKGYHEQGTNQFTYDSAKSDTIKFLKESQEELEKIAKELYKSKISRKDPYKKIKYVSYVDSSYASFEKSSYVEFYIDGQGFGALGGQRYGLIYSEDPDLYDGKDVFVYDIAKETDGYDSGYYIRERIDAHWYYYFEDDNGWIQVEEADGKLKVTKKES